MGLGPRGLRDKAGRTVNLDAATLVQCPVCSHCFLTSRSSRGAQVKLLCRGEEGCGHRARWHLFQEPNDADLMKLRASCAEKLAGQQQRRAEMAARASGDVNAEEAMAIQAKVNDLNEQCDMMKGSLMQKQREKHKAGLTQKTLGETPADTRMYIGVGRTFVLEPREAIEKKLTSKLEKLEDEIPRLEKTHSEMEKRKEAAEKEWTEICEASVGRR